MPEFEIKVKIVRNGFLVEYDENWPHRHSSFNEYYRDERTTHHVTFCKTRSKVKQKIKALIDKKIFPFLHKENYRGEG